MQNESDAMPTTADAGPVNNLFSVPKSVHVQSHFTKEPRNNIAASQGEGPGAEVTRSCTHTTRFPSVLSESAKPPQRKW